VSSPRKHSDRLLLGIILTLVAFGLFIFASASLGTLARTSLSIVSIAANQVLLGVVGGLAAMFLVSRINYRVWRKYAPVLFALALFLSLLVFVPGLGIEANNAKRWIAIGPLSLQPGETLKVATIILFAYLLSKYRGHVVIWPRGILLYIGVLLLPAGVLLSQPDSGTLGIIIIATGAMFLAAGARFRDIVILAVVGIIMLGALAAARPYVAERIATFANPFADQRDSGYQIKQSLIAIGSGGLLGRGFGQSIQKFGYLPEPTSDSIFAVAAEEFGFVGTTALIALFMAFAGRGLWVASRSPDYFGALLGTGIVAYISGQAFINMAAMLGLIPLTGIPLVFISRGGTAMLVALASCGILLNISRYARRG